MGPRYLASGAVVASWDSAAGSGGLWFQQVAPSQGVAQKLPVRAVRLSARRLCASLSPGLSGPAGGEHEVDLLLGMHHCFVGVWHRRQGGTPSSAQLRCVPRLTQATRKLVGQGVDCHPLLRQAVAVSNGDGAILR